MEQAKLRVGHVHITPNEVVLYAIPTEVMHGLLEQRWLATASHGAALWRRGTQHSPHPSDYAPEAAPQAEG